MTTSDRSPLELDPAAAKALEIGARLRQGPSKTLVDTAFDEELNAQLPLFDALNRVDLAHTLVLAETGVIPKSDAAELLQALLRLGERPPDFVPAPDHGDLYTNRECWLETRTPAARWFGTGRARREALTTAYTLKLREDLSALLEALIGYGRTLIARAEHYKTALMPDYTYLQAAQPTTFGHYLSAFAYPVLRDLDRMRELYRRLNRCPAGCGSSNGSRLPQARERLSRLLGFDAPVEHARDAMWQADLQIETAAVVGAVLINLDRLAEDLQIFATDEFALIELDDRHARASKIMPQKKNPFALTHLRSLANGMVGTLAASAAFGRTPSGQPDNRLALYGLLPNAVGRCAGAVALLREVVAAMSFNADAARAKLECGFASATDVAEVLVSAAGLPFRDAHRLVGALVRERLDRGGFEGLTPDDIAECSKALLGYPVELDAAVLAEALNPETSVAARCQPGGAAADALTAMFGQCRKALNDAEWELGGLNAKADAADKELTRGIDVFLSDTAR